MRLRTPLIPLLLAAVLSPDMQAWAAGDGGTSSGGGHVVIGENGQVAIADPFATDLKLWLAESGLKPFAFEALGSQVGAELNRAATILEAMTENKVPATEQQLFVSNQIRDAKNRYYWVESIPELPECQEKLAYAQLPSGARLAQVACTVERDTLLVKKLFESLSPREQVLLLVHEGLRRLPLSQPRLIAHITNGLSVALGIMDEQRTGKLNRLSDRQVQQLTFFYQAALTLGLQGAQRPAKEGAYPSYITPNGGALISKAAASVDPTAFLGVGIYIAPRGSVGENVTIVDSRLISHPGLQIRPNVKILSSRLWIACVYRGWQWAGTPCTSIIAEGFVAENAVAGNIEVFGENVQVRNSKFEGYWLTLNRHTSLENVEIENGIHLELGEGARLMNIPGAELKQDSTFLSSIGHIGVDTYEILPGRTIDFEGQRICASGTNLFLSRRFQQPISSKEDLKNLCSSH